MLFTNGTPVSSLNCITKILRHQDKTIVWEKIDATSEKKTTNMGKCPQNVQVLSSKESYSKSSSILLKYNCKSYAGQSLKNKFYFFKKFACINVVQDWQGGLEQLCNGDVEWIEFWVVQYYWFLAD